MRNFKLYSTVAEKYSKITGHHYDMFFNGVINNRVQDWDSILKWDPEPIPHTPAPKPKLLRMGKHEEPVQPTPTYPPPTPEFLANVKHFIDEFYIIWGELVWANTQYATVFVTEDLVAPSNIKFRLPVSMSFECDIEPVLISKLTDLNEAELLLSNVNARRFTDNPVEYNLETIKAAFSKAVGYDITNSTNSIIVSFGGRVVLLDNDLFKFMCLPVAITDDNKLKIEQYINANRTKISSIFGLENDSISNDLFENVSMYCRAYAKLNEANLTAKSIPTDSNINRDMVRNVRTCYTITPKVTNEI